MISGYLARSTWLHRVPAGPKLVALAVASLALLPVSDWRLLAALLATVLLAYGSLGREALGRLRHLKPLLPLLGVIGVLQGVTGDWMGGAAAILRILLMVLLADLVTMTTTMRAMMDALEPPLRPLQRLGLDTRKLALGVALVLRFVPVLIERWRAREEAWRARSGRRIPVGLIPLFIADTFRLADHVAEALEARGFAAIKKTDQD